MLETGAAHRQRLRQSRNVGWEETDKQYIIAGWRCACEHLADPGNADGIDLCQSGPVRVSEAIKEVYYEHQKESCSHHRRVARYRCGPRQGIS